MLASLSWLVADLMMDMVRALAISRGSAATSRAPRAGHGPPALKPAGPWLSGWTGRWAEVIEDNDLSAHTGRRRPAYQRMLTDLRGATATLS